MNARIVNGRPVVDLDGPTASVLEQLASYGIKALQAQSAGGWRPDAPIAAAIQVLRDAQTVTASAPTISDIGSPIASPADVLAQSITASEAAAILKVKTRRVGQLAETGELAGRRTSGLWLLYRPSVIERLVNRPGVRCAESGSERSAPAPRQPRPEGT